MAAENKDVPNLVNLGKIFDSNKPFICLIGNQMTQLTDWEDTISLEFEFGCQVSWGWHYCVSERLLLLNKLSWYLRFEVVVDSLSLLCRLVLHKIIFTFENVVQFPLNLLNDEITCPLGNDFQDNFLFISTHDFDISPLNSESYTAAIITLFLLLFLLCRSCIDISAT